MKPSRGVVYLNKGGHKGRDSPALGHWGSRGEPAARTLSQSAVLLAGRFDRVAHSMHQRNITS